jgi:hypothetical protein
MKRQTIRLDDGYNGGTVLLFADPLETDGSMVKLQVAEPGRGHLFRWAFRVVVEKLVAQKKAGIRHPLHGACLEQRS